MSVDARAALRLVDELLWFVRREGFTVSTSQAIDAVRAIELVGFSSPRDVKAALQAIIVQDAARVRRFEASVDAFFARPGPRSWWQRLQDQGVSDQEVQAMQSLFADMARASPDAPLVGLLSRGAELDRLLQLAGVTRLLETMQSPLQAGFFAHKALQQVGYVAAKDSLARVESLLSDAFGADRARALVALLRRELELAADDVRNHVRQAAARREERGPELGLSTRDFARLDESEIEAVRRAVKAFADRLRGKERVRSRHARRGRLDAHRTLRAALRTGGVPVKLVRKVRRRDMPRLFLLCDVSDSVRVAARFLLEFVHASQTLFNGTRSFVFVSELGETTALFEREPVHVALGKAYSGFVVPVSHNSNYGRVLRSFVERHLQDVNRKTTVVVLGDGRSNFHDDGATFLDAIRRRARALMWLSPESRATWGTGDSAMMRYAAKCTRVLEVASARDLERAAREILVLR